MTSIQYQINNIGFAVGFPILKSKFAVYMYRGAALLYYRGRLRLLAEVLSLLIWEFASRFIILQR